MNPIFPKPKVEIVEGVAEAKEVFEDYKTKNDIKDLDTDQFTVKLEGGDITLPNHTVHGFGCVGNCYSRCILNLA